MRRDINRIVNRYVRRCGSRNPFDIAEYLFAADLIISDELFTEARECNYTEGQLARLAHCCKRLVRLRLEQEAEL